MLLLRIGDRSRRRLIPLFSTARLGESEPSPKMPGSLPETHTLDYSSALTSCVNMYDYGENKKKHEGRASQEFRGSILSFFKTLPKGMLSALSLPTFSISYYFQSPERHLLARGGGGGGEFSLKKTVWACRGFTDSTYKYSE